MKAEQLQYECDTWRRQLSFMMDENVHLKNRLSDVLKERFDKTLLEAMENFQSLFIKEDESISLLRNDIADIEKLLQKERNTENPPSPKIVRKIRELRNNMVVTEAKFSKLQSEFYTFLHENL
ncbi:MAG: hypothetical protein U0V75_14645 [Ferruginibacter sp.]